MRLPKAVTALAALLLALLILSFSIAVPILFRPFYYIQIDMLDLPERTGWSEETIREAYDEVLDFCVFGKPFGTGQLAWSQSGYSHFADVRELLLKKYSLCPAARSICATIFSTNIPSFTSSLSNISFR